MYLVDEFEMNVTKESFFIAWVAVPLVLVNLFLTGRFFSPKTTSIVSGLFMSLWMILIVIPSEEKALWFTLFFTALGIALLIPSCATVLSLSVVPKDQGRVMGNNQSLQVGAEAISGLLGGLIAAIWIPLPLILLAIISLGGVFIFWSYREV